MTPTGSTARVAQMRRHLDTGADPGKIFRGGGG